MHGWTDISAQFDQKLTVKLSYIIYEYLWPCVGKKNTLICCMCQELKTVFHPAGVKSAYKLHKNMPD